MDRYMQMEVIDRLILGILFLVVMVVGFYAKKYVKGVSGFLAAVCWPISPDHLCRYRRNGTLSIVAAFEQYDQ